MHNCNQKPDTPDPRECSVMSLDRMGKRSNVWIPRTSSGINLHACPSPPLQLVLPARSSLVALNTLPTRAGSDATATTNTTTWQYNGGSAVRIFNYARQ
ncbi:Hypothetical protein NTJ_02204 [Nesidiocoris tenuis]|uniref:Uncharacterized protein n=1 Tax=Nesidiocoris tenuis TaxID=355587 RepID=A0ABN7AAS1_9HEMI|nr:Hypothetical protein NTJ_02204 [Nesidiocoris tenuis]